MKTIIIYEVKGKRFYDQIEAKKYEKLYEEVESIMSRLAVRTKEIENGLGYIKHDLQNLKQCFEKFCEVCAKTIPRYKEWFVQTARGERNISHIGRILSDYGSDYPILRKTLFRFECISFENGYEFQQRYYVTHQDEFFEDLRKRLEYKNDGN